MTNKPSVFHGSDVEVIASMYGIPVQQITAFGSNVNPLGISPLMEEALKNNVRAVTSYPDRNYQKLRSAIAHYTGTNPRQVLPGNGSTELISLAMKVTGPGRACILAPTYGEYRREISLAGGSCCFFPLKEETGFAVDPEQLESFLKESGSDLLVLCNPNNPTGTMLDNQTLDRILSFCRSQGIFVTADETYMEFTGTQGAVPLLSRFDNLLILRGTSKFFACPGLRLGYALSGNEKLLGQMAALQDPWSVSVPASIAGEVMFTDRTYIENTKEFIAGQRRRIVSRLEQIRSLRLFSPAANFLLVKILDPSKTAHDFFEFSIRQGLMIRDCSDFEGLGPAFFRFCFLDRQSNDRLLDCIESFFQ